MRANRSLQHRLLLLLCFLVLTTNASSSDECELYLAPSKMGGWGVFTNRPFRAMEIVEIAPFFLPMEYDLAIISGTIMDDYIYGYQRLNETGLYHFAGVVFGNAFFYNHHPTSPNVEWISFGREPIYPGHPVAQAVGWVARRDINVGEELFSSYAGNDHDGGLRWFSKRGIQLKDPSTLVERRRGEPDALQYCSNLYAGVGKESWRKVLHAHQEMNYKLPYYLDESSRLKEKDTPHAIVKKDAVAGQVLEVAPALLVPRHFMRHTALAPLGIYWEMLDGAQKDSIRMVRKGGGFRVQIRTDETNWKRADGFTSFEESVIVPMGGMLGLAKRSKHPSGANCALEFNASEALKADGSADVVLKLIAKRDLRKGEHVVIHMKDITDTGTTSRRRLLNEVEITGQAMPSHFIFTEFESDGSKAEL